MPITEYPPIQPGNWGALNNLLLAGWLTLSKAADETRTGTTTLTDDAILKFNMLASTNYRIRGKVFFDTTANGDFKYAMNAPSAPTLIRGVRTSCIAGGTPAELVVDVAAVGSTSLAGAGTTGGYVAFDFLHQNGVNAGLWSFQWAQDTSDAGNTIVRAGSYLEYAVA
jgi:hypothetical protein